MEDGNSRQFTASVRIALLVVVFLVALSAATVAPTRPGVRAWLTTKLPLDARPATTIRVGWTVDLTSDSGGRRGFNARGMFVKLLSATGAPATIGFARRTARGLYAAEVLVPVGGTGGVRMGMRGSADVYFPLENDPFSSPGGARCDVTAVRATLTRFVRAYNRGDVRLLDRLFSRERFVWYSSGKPGLRRLGDAANRATLIPYLRRRHRRGDRLALLGYRFNGYERGRGHGQFELSGRRRANDFRGGRWFTTIGKGAIDCSELPRAIAVLSLGGAVR